MINQFQYDRLTRLYSREFFFQKAHEILTQNPDKEYNIVCSNIVNFKLYNDTFGITAGDRLLKEFADGIRDLLGGEGISCRYSAEPDVPAGMLIEQADQALYQAKCRGKGICLLWGS